MLCGVVWCAVLCCADEVGEFAAQSVDRLNEDIIRISSRRHYNNHSRAHHGGVNPSSPMYLAKKGHGRKASVMPRRFVVWESKYRLIVMTLLNDSEI